jgi:hypothetical protein
MNDIARAFSRLREKVREARMRGVYQQRRAPITKE